MLIPRLKNGGKLAEAINALIDYLPRLQIQNSPTVSAVVTPRGQILTIKRAITESGDPLPDTNHPFRVFLKPRNATPTDTTQEAWVQWGAINGQPALDFPDEKVSGNLEGSQRVTLQVAGNFQTLTAAGIQNPLLSLESSDDPLAAQETDQTITWKIVLAYLETVPGEPLEGGGVGPKITTISQQTRGHLTIGNGVPFST